MEKTQQILFHIDELYTDSASELKTIRQSKENPARYQAWVDAFKDYDLSDILQAIDNFWEFKNSKTKPNVAQIKAILNSHRVEKAKEDSYMQLAYIPDFAITQMQKDIELGKNRHLLPVYKLAYEYAITELLLKEVPLEVWIKMSMYQKHKSAVDKGLLGNFDDLLIQTCEKHYGKKYQFPSTNMINYTTTSSSDNAVDYLASQWRAN